MAAPLCTEVRLTVHVEESRIARLCGYAVLPSCLDLHRRIDCHLVSSTRHYCPAAVKLAPLAEESLWTQSQHCCSSPAQHRQHQAGPALPPVVQTPSMEFRLNWQFVLHEYPKSQHHEACYAVLISAFFQPLGAD